MRGSDKCERELKIKCCVRCAVFAKKYKVSGREETISSKPRQSIVSVAVGD